MEDVSVALLMMLLMMTMTKRRVPYMPTKEDILWIDRTADRTFTATCQTRELYELVSARSHNSAADAK
jgi:hypothetical protein